MEKRIFYPVIIILLLFLILPLHSQTISTRLSTYFYTWERYDSVLTVGEYSSTSHLRGYQNFLLDITEGKWSFSTSIQTEEDFIEKSDRGFAYRFYNAYIKGSNLFDMLDVKLGRQYVSAGTGRGTLDGINLKLKLGKEKEFHLSGYAGGLTPYTYNFDDYGVFFKNFAFGGQLSYFGVKDLKLSASYFNKNRKPQSYTTVRADSSFNRMEYVVDIDEFADQLGGMDFSFRKPKYNFFGKLYYDFNLKKLYRGEINGSVNATDKLKFSLGYTYRQPQISYNSIFWVFNYRQYNELELGADYLVNKNINIYARAANVFYTDENSLRVQLGFSHPNYGLSIIKYTGYAGESEGAYGYFNYELMRSKLSLTSGLSYSNYKIKNYSDEKENSLSGMLGFTYRPVNRITIDVQGQLISNRIYKTDTRLLLGINYWLFSKL
jgi:hypothetical protein